MITLTSFSFWLNFVYFFVVFFVVFFIPGSVILKRFKFSLFQHIVLSSVVGITLWALQAFIFGFLGFRNFSYIYLILFILIWIRINGDLVKRNKWKINPQKLDYLTFLILIIGSIVQFYPIFFNGINTNNGLYFCCGGKDLIYHISLTKELVDRFPPMEPAAWSVIVSNYHYLSNLALSEIIRIFHLPLIATQAQYFPPVLSFLIGLSFMVFAQICRFPKLVTRLSLLFLYFFGDITVFLMIILGKGVRFDIPIISNFSFWVSPPRLFAIPIFFAGFSFIILWFREKKLFLGLLSAILFASLIGFKIYFGLFAALGYLFLSLFILYKKDYLKFIPIILFGLISFLLFYVVNRGSGGLIFTYFWRFENFVAQPGFELTNLELARYVYLNAGNYLKVGMYEVFYVLIYFIFSFGVINFAIFQTKKSISYLTKEINIFLIPATLLSLIIGFFFIQKTGGANTSQFIITAIIVASIYAAISISAIYNKIGPKLKIIFLIFILFITLPRVIHDTWAVAKNIYMQKGGSLLTASELSAFNHLKNDTNKKDLVLAYKVGYSCYFVNFISDRKLFLCDEPNGILSDHAANVEKRITAQEIIFLSASPNSVKKELENNNISYIYLPVNLSPFATASANFLKPVFQNSSVKILKFIPNNDTINL